MKKTLSFFLSLLMVISVLTACSIAGNAVLSVTEISNTNPCITADAGEKIDLGGYAVVFDGDTVATDSLTWKIGDETITTFTPEKKGVTALTAISGDKTKTIYVVAKNANETEYVLYEANFSNYTSISQLKDEGWVFLNADSRYSIENTGGDVNNDGSITAKDYQLLKRHVLKTYTLSDASLAFADINGDGKITATDYQLLKRHVLKTYTIQGGTMNIGSIGDDYARAILPAWLGDFGDYSITADMKMLKTADTRRWFGLVYRIQDDNKNKYYPYYHMCIREKASVSNGIEFAERTAGDAWNVATTAASQTLLSDGYHTAKVEANGTNIRYSMDGTQILYITKSVIGIQTGSYSKGYIGITMNYGVTSLKYIKVCVQSEKPAADSVATKLTNNQHQNISFRNPIAIVDTVASASEIEKSIGNVYYNVNGTSVTEVLKKAISESCIPNFYCATKADVDKIASALNTVSTNDLCVISSDPEVLKYAKTKKSAIRCGLEIELTKNTLTSKEANDIRLAVRSAPATFCVISGENVSYQAVRELQELAVAVWVKVKSASGTDAYALEAANAINSGANGIICDSAKSLADFMNTYYSSTAMSRTPIIIGHRGNPTQAPENSMASFKKAYENGADVFEIDVEITKDKEIIIMHDNTINRTSNYSGTQTINEMTLEEIRDYYLLNNDGTVSTEKIPTLKELFEYFKDKDIRIFIEFKGSTAENVPAACALIKEYGMEDRVDIISFSTYFLSQTQAQIPGMSTGYLCSGGGAVSTVEASINTFYTYWSTANSVKSSVNPNATSFDFIQVGTDRGITIWPWTFASSSNNGAFFSGCDGVTTNDCQWFKNMYQYISVSATTETLAVGAKSALTVSGETYGRTKSDINKANLNVVVLSGNDCVEVTNGNITAKKSGTAVVMFEYVTKSAAGTEYTLYTAPVVITVG